jgi:hypothetical protein
MVGLASESDRQRLAGGDGTVRAARPGQRGIGAADRRPLTRLGRSSTPALSVTWAGAEGSSAYYRGEFSADDQTVTGDWVYSRWWRQRLNDDPI